MHTDEGVEACVSAAKVFRFARGGTRHYISVCIVRHGLWGVFLRAGGC